MEEMDDDDPEAWICEKCKLGDQIPPPKPNVSFACPSPDKQPSNTATRSNIRKPPRNTKVQYISPEEAMGLESGAQKKISSSPSNSNLLCRPTMDRTPPPKITVKPSPLNRPPGFTKIQSTRNLPNASRDTKLSGYKDTQKYAVQQQFDRQGSPLGIKLSPKKAQTSNATTEERNTQKYAVQQQFDRQGSPLGIKTSPKKVQTSNATTEERNKGPAKQLYKETSARTPVHLEKVPKSNVGVTENPGNASIQFVQHSLATSSDKGPARQLGRETPAARPSLSGKISKTNAGREKMNPGHTSPQLVEDLPAASSDKGPAPKLLGDTSAWITRHLEKLPKCSADILIEKTKNTSVQPVQHLPAVSSEMIVCVDALGEKFGYEDKESLGFKLELDKYHLNHPAELPTWRGRFNIEDDHIVLRCRSLDGIQAHPPCKVHRKVYDMSKQLPETLQFELLPGLNIWANLLKDVVPGAQDIGLYFLSPKSTFLISFLDEHDMFLKCQIDGVELLVFSSRHLPVESQRINKELFLWGLFRSSEDNTVALGEDSGEDMDIDMSGGKEVGIIDHVVRKPTNDTSPHPTVPDLTPTIGSLVGTDPDLPLATSFLPDEFERDLQRCLNKFEMLKQPEEVRVKKEHESPGR